MGIVIENKNITLTTNKVTNPSVVFEKNGQVLYGALLDKKPNYPTLVINNKYLTSIDIALGSHSWVRNHWGGSNNTYSNWETVQPVAKQGFVNNVTFSVHIHITSGNYDAIGFSAYIINKNDTSKKIYLASNWGIGDNWWWDQSYSHTLTETEKQQLGGPNTELMVQFQMMNNRGSGGMSSRYTFTLVTS